jgi:transposase
VVHAADIQDRDGAALVLDGCTRALFPFILAIFADAGYRGPRAATAARRSGRWRLRVVRRPEAARGFVVLPQRWIVTARTILPVRASNGPKRSGAATCGTWSLPGARAA